ncbi:MAG TPA: MlaA family lipoprotein [Xanthomonadaceae bacterium]|nr:MlaA family lipoprotein [Xanthomonadaceae bacterium]
MRVMPPAIASLALACAVLLLAGCASRPVHEASATGTFVVVDPEAADAPSTPAGAASAAIPPAAAAPPAPASPPTQAELDFAALYGGEVYNPVADPTLPEPAQLPVPYDPWESFNRRMHAVNTVIDERIARPLATAYMDVVPRPIRLGVGNFFRNLGQPVSALNALLQGRPKQAGQGIARFLLNTTVGLGGIFDPATEVGLPLRNEDFGQTLGVWGWETSRYVELPLFGPRTVRDVVGLFGDAPLSPLRQVEEDKVRVMLQGLQLVDVRTQLLALDSMLEGAPDEYALLRDAWLQRRNYQIQGDKAAEADESLPDYLREEQLPTVPVDAMPVLPDGG